ncbi:MAG TPA: aminotransferase class I/II-fold pyridoxal phosphate-dependent enzyme [Patescibacteria group bacterium]|nr:aminotransferase class I/II-fold pyridoxal phosphate-dependent enzyme [Patescibacteria group bacterium]
MAIFNSLGSNYNLSYVLKSLATVGSASDKNKLTNLLEEKYGGKATLFYKGREALTATIKALDLPEDAEIAINGFTCVAVFNAIRTAGAEPVCIDLEETGGLNFTPEGLLKSLRMNKKIKAVVVQNTLGYPCNIEEIQKICKEHKLILIEDLAHCIGAKYKNGKEAGTVGDFVVLSFSQDKIIDAVSGGAVVVRNIKYQISNIKYQKNAGGLRERFYPSFTYKIREMYGVGLGKAYHFLLKKMGFLSNIMDESLYEYYSLPSWNASLAVFQFKTLSEQLSHRRKIASIYVEELSDSMFMFDKQKTLEAVKLSSNLRFPIFVEQRSKLLKKLKEQGIYLEDIWYVDVAPECPNAVADSKIIVNLPTHINVREKDAMRICTIINNFLSPRA